MKIKICLFFLLHPRFKKVYITIFIRLNYDIIISLFSVEPVVLIFNYLIFLRNGCDIFFFFPVLSLITLNRVYTNYRVLSVTIRLKNFRFRRKGCYTSRYGSVHRKLSLFCTRPVQVTECGHTLGS